MAADKPAVEILFACGAYYREQVSNWTASRSRLFCPRCQEYEVVVIAGYLSWMSR